MFSRVEEFDIYNHVIDLYGAALQQLVVIEECNELIIALENLREKKESNAEEEIADVEIMINQLCVINDFDVCKELAMNPVEVDVARLSNSVIISLSELVQAIVKGIRGKKVDLKTKAYKAWAYVQFLKSILGPAKVEEIKQEKLKKLKDMVLI